MPGRTYNAKQRAAYKKKQKRASKAYANRQQKLSVQTVKDIAKEVINDVAETKYYTFSEESEVYYLGHPQLWDGANHPWQDDLLPGRGSPFMSQIFTNLTIPYGNQPESRIGNKIFIKGFRLQMRLVCPPNVSHVFNHTEGYYPNEPDSCAWYEVHWMLFRQPRGLSSEHSIFQLIGDDFTLRPRANRDKTRPRLKSVASGKYRFTPTISATAIDQKPVHNIDATFTRTSTMLSKYVDKYIPINKSFNMADQTAQRQPDPYCILVWSRQDKQLVSPHVNTGTEQGGDLILAGDGMYVGVYDNGANVVDHFDDPDNQDAATYFSGLRRFNVGLCGLKVHMYYTDI